MSKHFFALIILATTQRAVIGDSQPHQLMAVPIQQVTIDDEFWSPKLKVWCEVTIPDCFTKFESDRGGAFNNFDRVRDGKLGGHAGPEWCDGLIYEMIRASADFLAERPDPALEKRLDGYIERIAAAAAKDSDGYLNTWTQLMAPEKRWGSTAETTCSSMTFTTPGRWSMPLSIITARPAKGGC